MLPPNTILRERYRIINQLGRGGMGAVYHAMDENLNCVVAVKETFAKTEEHRRAFRREAELLANLNHPTLPKVMDHFTHGEEQFLVMQFVSGHDLAELLELREQPFAVEKVLGWADQLLDALEELHSYEPPIVHRDIKPSNLKVTPKGRVVLLDFGLAKGAAGQMSTADADSQPKSIYGYTPNYAPLEQIRGAGTDPRSDLYSLAATMWSLLTGKVPPDALSRVVDKEEGKPDPLIPAHELNAGVPLSVSEAIGRAMSLNRTQRPATAAEMRKELHAFRPAEAGPHAEGSSTAETMKMPEAPSVSTLPNQPAATMPVPKPPPIPSRAPVVGPTVASLSPVKTSDPKQGDQKNRAALIGAGVALTGAAILIVAIVAITLAVWQPWSKKSGLTSTPASSTKPSTSNPNGAPRSSIDLVWVPPGSFVMGSNSESSSEMPVHRVTFANGFYIGKYEVTQAQWESVMGNNSSVNKGCGGNCPIDSVSWNDAQEFIRKLNRSSSGYTYRLPTEAEWEYAARAGTTGDYYASSLDSIAWYKENADGRSHPVGQKQANAFGLYDMIGNVTEWVQDAHHPNYDGAPTDGSEWSSGGEQSKVLRGGSWHPYSHLLQSASRGFNPPDKRDADYGFRVVGVR